MNTLKVEEANDNKKANTIKTCMSASLISGEDLN